MRLTRALGAPAFALGALALTLAVAEGACTGSGEITGTAGAGGANGGATGAAGSAGTGAAGIGGATGTAGTAATGSGGRGGATGTAGAAGTGNAGGGGSSGASGAGGAGNAGLGGTSGTAGAGGAGNAGRGGTTGTAGGGGAGAGGRGGTTGTAGTTGAAGATATNKVFGQCRFHFGAIDSVAKSNASMVAQLDFFTPGWMGQADTFNMTSVCTEAKAGATFANQVPVIVAYVAAFYVKRHNGLCDCNVTSCGANNDLCHAGAADINNSLTNIVNVYKSYAQGFASCYGTTKPIIFEMEPDFYQYVGSTQTAPWTEDQAGTIMGQFVAAVKQSLPNAVFSMDISPWVGKNGADNGAEWYSHFDMTQFTYVNTSGGSTDATSTRIRPDNMMTWAGVHQATGKPILADTGYGVAGSSAGPDANWDNATNINARIADGVVAISQYNPASSWGTTISSVRSQLGAPVACP